MKTNNRIDNWINNNQKEAIEFLQSIIRIPSVTGDEAEVQDFIEAYIRDMGLEIDKFEPSIDELKYHPAYVEESIGYHNRPNVVGILKGTGGGRSLILNGHVDVIPEGDQKNWEHGCWSGDISKGKLYGRGASDMKSGVAALTMAVLAIKELGIQLKGDLIMQYVVDEELTGNGTLACVIKGYKADAGICCETSSMRVQPASIGRLWFNIHVDGKATGIQRKHEGVNAIDMGYLVMKAVEKFEQERISKVKHPLYPNIEEAIPCMVGMFESGTYNSAFPDTCLLKGSLATVPGEDSQKVIKELEDFVTKEVSSDPWLRANPPEFTFDGFFAEPSEIPVDSPIVETLCKNYERTLKTKPVISGREGAADIRFLNEYGDTPTVIFGPGMTEQMHSNNEWVKLKDYLDSIKILAKTIVEWCEVY